MSACPPPGFKPDTAYMEVPRCDGCRWWKPFNEVRHMGDCTLFQCTGGEQVHPMVGLQLTRTGTGEGTVVTDPDFGCVKWEAK